MGKLHEQASKRLALSRRGFLIAAAGAGVAFGFLAPAARPLREAPPPA